jgi:hypothetical protein
MSLPEMWAGPVNRLYLSISSRNASDSVSGMSTWGIDADYSCQLLVVMAEFHKLTISSGRLYPG